MDLSAAILEDFGSLLEFHSFQLVKPRWWVRDVKPSIRELFNVAPLKGASYSVRWGFSLDFVPLMWTKPPRWKRTNKSAHFDLVIEPLDQGSEEFVFHHLPGYDEVERTTIQRIAQASIQRALSDFDAVKGIEDIPRMFTKVSMLPAKRFSLDNYTQAHLAWGITLLRLGEVDKGHALVARACALHRIDGAHPILARAMAPAASPRA
jgi:hypothetical protein